MSRLVFFEKYKTEIKVSTDAVVISALRSVHFDWIYLQDCNDETTSLLRLSGEQGPDWHQAVVSVPAQTYPHSFVLEAVHGNGVLSDIAFDDIEYYVGKCKCKLNSENIWTVTSEGTPSDTCAQRWFRSACAFAQSAQNFHWAYFG